ncbi:MAG: hypothetical protein WBL27_12730 [Salinimicrobium sp.]
MKKAFVIIVLFALPLVAYLFFASGVNHFARLPVLTDELYGLENFSTAEDEQLSFDDNITILAFPGEHPYEYLTNAYHLAEKIYKPYHQFKDFHFVFVAPEGTQAEVERLKTELSEVVELSRWRFVYGTKEEIKKLYGSLGTKLELDEQLSSPKAFIVDKAGKLRGREEDEDGQKLYGYDTNSIAVLNNKMTDDVKVILAEYRLELKKYNKVK